MLEMGSMDIEGRIKKKYTKFGKTKKKKSLSTLSSSPKTLSNKPT